MATAEGGEQVPLANPNRITTGSWRDLYDKIGHVAVVMDNKVPLTQEAVDELTSID